MLVRHDVTTVEANEVLEDDDALWFDPDPSSKSGLTARVVGWSFSRQQVLTVILLHVEDDWAGVNGWVTKSGRDRTAYRKGTS